MYLIYWKAAVNKNVLIPDLNELKVLADFRCSGSLFHRWGAQKQKAASLCFVLNRGTLSKAVPDDLRGPDAL